MTPHPLDNDPAPRFDDGNGQRIMLGPLGVKAHRAATTRALLPPARTFDTLTGDAVGGLYFAFEKYGVQVGAGRVRRRAPTRRRTPRRRPADAVRRSSRSSTYNVENLYDFRDDPFDGCDFLGNTGCPGVSPPFDYVPASAEADYNEQLAALADQIRRDLHSPDVILVQEAEDQDICTVTGGALVCGATDNADGKPDTLQELALTIAAAGGPAYDAAYDRDGADDRGITAAFLYRTDRVSLAPPTPATRCSARRRPSSTGRRRCASNADVQNPKSLNAELPADVDTLHRRGRVQRLHPRPAGGQVPRRGDARRRPSGSLLWAVSNHFSSGPDSRVGQRREQAAYGAAIVTAIEAGRRRTPGSSTAAT